MNVPAWVLPAVAGAVTGLVTGSFLSVLAARVPAAAPIARPLGRCPHCGAAVRLADMAPLAGWLRLRGRCRDCGARYGGWYPLLELATAALFAMLAVRLRFSPLLPALWYLAAVGLALAVIDVRHHRLPDALTLPSYPVAAVLLGGGGLLLPGGAAHLLGALLGLAGAGVFYLLLALLAPGGIGWGDVKLSGLLGFYLGWFGLTALIAGVFGAFVLAAVTGLALIAAGKATRKSQLPFGAFMLAAAIAVIAVSG
jgi:leader peptidase (prepilin peptidase) / N-methyltransferase